MNYIKIYNSLIYNRQVNKLYKNKGIYVEKHHIIPRSCGGSDDKSNIVYLTAREHYISHLLLSKIYYNTEFYSKMILAINAFQTLSDKRKIKLNSKLYEKYRNIAANFISRNNGELYEFNGKYLTLLEISKLTNIPRKTLYHRLKKHKSIYDCLYKLRERPKYPYNGKEYSLMEISKITGIPFKKLKSAALSQRYGRMPPEQLQGYIERYLKRERSNNWDGCKRIFYVNGEYLTITQIAEKYVMDRTFIANRIFHDKMSPQDIINTFCINKNE